MAEFKISTMLISFLIFTGFIMVGTSMMLHAFSIDTTTRDKLDKITYYDRVSGDINSLNSDSDNQSIWEKAKDFTLNTITLGYWTKVKRIERTFNYVSNGETGMLGMVGDTLGEIMPREVFYLIGLAFIVLILFTIFSLTFFRRI